MSQQSYGAACLEQMLDRRKAAKPAICACCQGPAVAFKDSLSQREYQISRMCQVCQDGVFDMPEGDD